MSETEIDPVFPTQIEHCIGEIWNKNQLIQQYVFFDYHFERDGAYCRARSYVDTLQHVVLCGPFDGRQSIRKVRSLSFERDVQAYLQRRFPNIDRG